MSTIPSFCYHNKVISNKPKLIVFDIGGVLLNWKIVIPKISNLLNITPESFFQELQLHLKNLELAKTHQIDFWKHLAKKYNPSVNPDLLQKTWIESQTRLEPSWDLLKKAKESGYRVVCCTNNWEGTVKRQAELDPDFSLFEFIVDSSEVRVKKPDKRIYRLVEKMVGEKGKDIFFIDDSRENCEGAENLGWQTFLFDSETDNGSKDADKILELLGL